MQPPRLSFDDLRTLADRLERHAAERCWPPGQIVQRTLQMMNLGQHTLDYHNALAQWRTPAPPPEPVVPEEPEPDDAPGRHAFERLMTACQLWHAQHKTTPKKLRVHPSVKALVDEHLGRLRINSDDRPFELLADDTIPPGEVVVVEAK